MTWKAWLGAVPDDSGTHFRVWAPKADSLAVKIAGREVSMRRETDGYYTLYSPGVRPGARYTYKFRDGRERPDPASLFQPEGVHGPSEVVDLAAIAQRTPKPKLDLKDLVFSELHLGTFTREGTADAAAAELPELAKNGFTAAEVMPVAAFSGDRGWGYDGVAPFAVHAAYGGPVQLARFVEAAHKAGLLAFLDVVYNHLGPEGNYLGEFAPYFTSKHNTPWGDALDFSLPQVRKYFLENALRWVSRGGAGFDGLRLDAIHNIIDDSPKHILQEIAEAVHVEGGLVIAESDLNDVKLVEQWGLDGSWADDLHHALHVALTAESQGYYRDFQDPLPKLVHALNRGWYYEGQHKPSFDRPHGTSAAHLPGRRFVVAAQNHDQIGNRAAGERLTALTDEGGLRVSAALIALQPALPLYFQGEEWAAREPFQYFTGHTDHDLAEAVRKGRHEEFKAFAWQGEVPDPQARETFERSKLDRKHQDKKALAWHRALLQVRRNYLTDDDRGKTQASLQGQVVLLHRGEILLVAGFGDSDFEVRLPDGKWQVLLDSAKAKLSDSKLQGSGRHAIVLQQG
ncbi:MAG TPA: malto-oligosyltrehalose trehalohydrolase [Myxococcales bacterium]|jgi:maltooligosyltrehalose trehalohydrolase|nr:malto-oligosyltrehalose trehalohydrolase [Myxococcales bacterium]